MQKIHKSFIFYLNVTEKNFFTQYSYESIKLLLICSTFRALSNNKTALYELISSSEIILSLWLKIEISNGWVCNRISKLVAIYAFKS